MEDRKLTISIMKRILAGIFAKHDHQEKVIVAIYRLFIPEWHRIEHLKSYPICGRELWLYICQLFITFDKEHHPKCMNGGLWISMGFSSDPKLGDWEVDLSKMSPVFKN